MLRAGKLKRRMWVQAATESRDSFGQPVKSWTNAATVYGADEPLSGAERYRAQQVNPNISRKVTLRREVGVTDGLTERHRLLSPHWSTTLATGINSTTQSVAISSGAGVQNVGEIIRISDEAMYVSAISGANSTALTVTRGYFSTTAAAHSSGDVVEALRAINIDAALNMDMGDRIWQVMGIEG